MSIHLEAPGQQRSKGRHLVRKPVNTFGNIAENADNALKFLNRRGLLEVENFVALCGSTV